jgi:hypothetical protein
MTRRCDHKRKLTYCYLMLLAFSLTVVGCYKSKAPAVASDLPQVATRGSMQPYNPTGVTGSNYFLVAHQINVCSGMTVSHTDASINWGDGNSWSGWVAGGPSHDLVGPNRYQSPGVYQVQSMVTATCIDNNQQPWGDSARATSTVYVFNSPPAIGDIACVPLSIKLGPPATQSTCKVTLSTAAAVGGTQVRLMSSAPTSISGVPLTITVPSGLPSAPTFKIKGLAVGTVSIYTTSGEQSTTAGVTLTITP